MSKLKLTHLFGFTLLALVLLAAGGTLGVYAVGFSGDPPDDPEINGPVAVDAPVPGGPGYYIGAASEFHPRLSTMGYALNGPQLRNTSASVGDVYFDAPVHLPDGVRILGFILYFVDNDATRNVTAELFCLELPGNSVPASSATVASSGASTTATYAQDTTISVPDVVDNNARACYVRLNLPVTNDIQVNGFRVDYGYQISMPLTTKNATP